MKRRKFIGYSSLAGAAALTSPTISFSGNQQLKDGTTILFQGDSITDAGRERAQYYPNQSAGMGFGYVRLIVSELLGKNPVLKLKFYNRGISGNKVYQLADRWEDDCLQLKPDVISILIGVNDYWHTLNGRYDGTVKVYEKDFRSLLTRTNEQLPGVKFIVGEPFTVAGGTHIDMEKWYPKFAGYQMIAKELAKEFDAAFIPYQRIFAEALSEAPASHWCPDGVHPSMAGCWLMAKNWIETFQNI